MFGLGRTAWEDWVVQKKKATDWWPFSLLFGAPEEIRTPDPQIRRLVGSLKNQSYSANQAIFRA